MYHLNSVSCMTTGSPSLREGVRIGHEGGRSGRPGSPALKSVPHGMTMGTAKRPFENVMAAISKNLPTSMDWREPGEELALDATSLNPSDDPGSTHESQIAEIVPTGARVILGLVEERGFSPEELCRGLGFTYRDLSMRDVRLSYRQMRKLFMRAERLLDEPALGLALGARQTPISWGVPGLAMLTCETYGEALNYGLSHQQAIGAMLIHTIEEAGREIRMEVRFRRFDIQLESVLVEDAFAGSVAVSRYLIGPSFAPLRVDFSLPKPSDPDVYRRFFQCPVRFDAGINRLTFDSHWLSVRLPGFDRVNSKIVRDQLDTLLPMRGVRNEIVESLSSHLRCDIETTTRQSELASLINVSERTLRRRLNRQDSSYRELRDEARYERARDLLLNSELSIAEVADAVGYSDARAFRRAFKRWAGCLPTEFRESR
ncbi:helix-turn-helix domain-containing protein [Stenotrophomonas maltophilia]|nr:helix-turn-helix domain-containing protein [Stenotrophomonas maltophilia]